MHVFGKNDLTYLLAYLLTYFRMRVGAYVFTYLLTHLLYFTLLYFTLPFPPLLAWSLLSPPLLAATLPLLMPPLGANLEASPQTKHQFFAASQEHTHGGALMKVLYY